jgi:hypothetical protein
MASAVAGANRRTAYLFVPSGRMKLEKAKIGVFITLADSTLPMRTEAVKAGYYETPYGKYPKIQILTIAELFDGKQLNIPLVDASAFKKAARESSGETNWNCRFRPKNRTFAWNLCKHWLKSILSNVFCFNG